MAAFQAYIMKCGDNRHGLMPLCQLTVIIAPGAPMLIVHSHNGRVDILFVLSFDIWRSAAHDVF